MFKLREYQIKALNAIDAALSENKNVLLQGITGCGKTVIFSRLVNKYYHETERRFLILVHKQEVVQQIASTLAEKTEIPSYDIGVCCASLSSRTIDARVIIASVQTFVNMLNKYSYADLIIIDEAHRVDINSDTQYKKIIDHLRLQRPECRIFGCTSTPARLGHGYIYGKRCKPGSVNLFDQVSHKITYAELLKEGHLVPLKGVAAHHKHLERDLAGVSVNGDYVLDQLGDIMCKEIHIHTAVEAIQKYCAGYKRICVFCCTIDHAVRLQEAIGEESTIVHSQLNQIDRYLNMKAWESGDKRIMTSVNILTEGFDMPVLDCLIFARPTLSSTLFLQAIGRVLRPHPGKDHGYIVDITDNTSRFGTDIDNVAVTVPKAVEAAIKKEKSIWKICPNCDVTVHIALRECTECGYAWAAAECVVAEALPAMKDVVFEKAPPVWKDVINFSARMHESKKNGKLLGKIDYYFQFSEYRQSKVSLFLCFADHYTGYAVEKSKEKWSQISDDEFPRSVEDFLRARLHTPTKILVDLNSKWPQLVDVDAEDDEERILAEISEELSQKQEIFYDDDVPF